MAARERAEHAAELGILVGRHQQAAQHLRQRLRAAAAGVLQHVAEPAAGAEADDRRRRQRHGPPAAHLAELRAQAARSSPAPIATASARSSNGFSETIRNAALGCE